MSLYHLVIYVPVTHADAVRKALAESGAGNIGNYDSCSFSSRGIGRFRPLKGSDPHIGSEGQIAEVEEERIEVVVEEKKLSNVLRSAKDAHPYEEPAIHFWKMEGDHIQSS
jgi:hypothetical protein